MYKLDGYMAGANLGHWISQYGQSGKQHFDSYITESDFSRMAEWGFDHVRLPVDYFLFEDDANPGVYREEGLQYIDFSLASCKKYGLNLALDLHHAPGFFFGDGEKNDLFTSEVSRQRFVNIWRFFAKRYQTEGDNLIFELLNELVWKNSDPWNILWQECAAEILNISPKRRIIVGGNFWNSVNELKNLHVSENQNIIYTFHCYEPFFFTHQRASWIERNRNYTQKVHYPTAYAEHKDYFDGHVPEHMTEDGTFDIEFMKRFLTPAFEFIEKNHRPLYCGEYGVIFNADVEDMNRWYADVAKLFLEHGIGRAVWSYRGFSLVTDSENRMVSKEMIDILTRK